MLIANNTFVTKIYMIWTLGFSGYAAAPRCNLFHYVTFSDYPNSFETVMIMKKKKENYTDIDLTLLQPKNEYCPKVYCT